MKNNMLDLHNHLMAQLETLTDDDVAGPALDEAIKRSRAVTRVATTIISNASLVLKAEQMKREHGPGDDPLPPMLTGGRRQ